MVLYIYATLRNRRTILARRNYGKSIKSTIAHVKCEGEGVGSVDLWGYFVGKEDMYVRDGLHLSGKGAAVFSENLLQSMDRGTGCNFLN